LGQSLVIVHWSWAQFQRVFFLLVCKHSALKVWRLMGSDDPELLSLFRSWHRQLA
jgi:hypothetical protein